MSSAAPRAFACESCQSNLDGRSAFLLRGRRKLQRKCPRCSLFDMALARRSAKVAAVVGTALIALNHGDRILTGSFPWASDWFKLLLTYAVPFLVATYGALSNGYVSAGSQGVSGERRDGEPGT